MARFYGTVRGFKKSITKQGSKSSGLITHCKSSDGSVRCEAYVNENGVDCVIVNLIPGVDKEEYQLLYDGPFDLQKVSHSCSALFPKSIPPM